MDIPYCLALLVFVCAAASASAKFIDSDIFDLEDHDSEHKSFRTFAQNDHDDGYYSSEYAPAPHPLAHKKELFKDGLWALKNKIEQLKMFEAAIIAKVKEDKKKIDADLHEKLEKLLHKKKYPQYHEQYQAPAAGYYQHPPQQYAPPGHDPYYGH